MNAQEKLALRSRLRDRWELVAAAIIFIGVLAVIDVVWLRQPGLLLSVAPFAFLLVAALVPLRLRWVGAWIGAFILLALATGRWSYAGLTLPALILALLRAMRRVRVSR